MFVVLLMDEKFDYQNSPAANKAVAGMVKQPGHERSLGQPPSALYGTFAGAHAHDGGTNHLGRADRSTEQRVAEDDDRRAQLGSKPIHRPDLMVLPPALRIQSPAPRRCPKAII